MWWRHQRPRSQKALNKEMELLSPNCVPDSLHIGQGPITFCQGKHLSGQLTSTVIFTLPSSEAFSTKNIQRRRCQRSKKEENIEEKIEAVEEKKVKEKKTAKKATKKAENAEDTNVQLEIAEVKKENNMDADKFVSLLKENNIYTYKDVVNFLDKNKLDPAEVAKLYEKLDEAGIKMIEEDIKPGSLGDSPDVDDNLELLEDNDDEKEILVDKLTSGENVAQTIAELEIEPNLEDISEIEKDILLEDINDISFTETLNVDDPVRMFLKDAIINKLKEKDIIILWLDNFLNYDYFEMLDMLIGFGLDIYIMVNF